MRDKSKTKFYGAFGSNLSKRQMKERCPAAIPYAASTLNGFMLCFKSVADVIPKTSHQVPVGIYEITSACEDALDVYESFPYLYRKEYIKLMLNNRLTKIMFYVMNKEYGFGKPSDTYYRTIEEGYIDWNLNERVLVNALTFSINRDTGNSFRSKRWDG